jgi:large-conductance mechanosensitive channel
MRQHIKGGFVGFLDFIRERGVAGLLIGFVLGGAISKVTTSFSTDILNPSLALVFGSTQKLADFAVGPIAIGKFSAALIDFFILALVIYILFKLLGLDKLDKPKQ